MLITSGWNFYEWDINIVSKYLPTKCSLDTKGKKSNDVEKILHNQVFKINNNINETNKNLISADRSHNKKKTASFRWYFYPKFVT